MYIYFNDLKVSARKKLAEYHNIPLKFFDAFDSPIACTDILSIDDVNTCLIGMGFEKTEDTEDIVNGVFNKNIVYTLNIKEWCKDFKSLVSVTDEVLYSNAIEFMFGLINDLAAHVIPKYSITFINRDDIITVICNVMIADKTEELTEIDDIDDESI